MSIHVERIKPTYSHEIANTENGDLFTDEVTYKILGTLGIEQPTYYRADPAGYQVEWSRDKRLCRLGLNNRYGSNLPQSNAEVTYREEDPKTGQPLSATARMEGVNYILISPHYYKHDIWEVHFIYRLRLEKLIDIHSQLTLNSAGDVHNFFRGQVIEAPTFQVGRLDT